MAAGVLLIAAGLFCLCVYSEMRWHSPADRVNLERKRFLRAERRAMRASARRRAKEEKRASAQWKKHPIRPFGSGL